MGNWYNLNTELPREVSLLNINFFILPLGIAFGNIPYVKFVLAFMFILPNNQWLAFVSVVLSVIGVYLAWTVITSRGKA